MATYKVGGRSWAIRGMLLSVVVSLATPQAAPSQVQIRSRATDINLTGRVHTQFNTTSATGKPETEFLMRRVRLAAEITISDFVSGKVEPDFGEGKLSLRDAWVRLTFSPAFRATIGQTKRPFDLFELTSSTQILVVERAGGIRGVETCSGVQGLCSFSQFTERLQYADRDIGVFMDGTAGPAAWAIAVTNGAGANKSDQNGAKSFTGRVALQAADGVTVGANVAVHDYLAPLGNDTKYATAWGADLEVGDFEGGLHVQAGAVLGDNWLNVAPTEPSSFRTAQAIVSYRGAITGSPYLNGFEPVLRLSWGDPNTDRPDDDGVLLTPGIQFHFTGRNKLAANVDVWRPATGPQEFSVKVMWYLYF